MIRLLVAALVLSACTCSTPAAAPPPQKERGPATCPAVCSHLRELGCAGGAPTPAGASCETVCSGVMATKLVSWDLGCRSAALTCAAVEFCEVQ